MHKHLQTKEKIVSDQNVYITQELIVHGIYRREKIFPILSEFVIIFFYIIQEFVVPSICIHINSLDVFLRNVRM